MFEKTPIQCEVVLKIECITCSKSSTTSRDKSQMECQTDQSHCMYLLVVYSPYRFNCETICFFTNYERALGEKLKLQEKIDAHEIKQKNYWKGRVWYPGPQVEYGNPKAEVVQVTCKSVGKVNPLYQDIVKNVEHKKPLASIPSSGRGCWFDYLKKQKIVYDNKKGAIVESVPHHHEDTSKQKETKATQTMPTTMWIVIDFFMDEHYEKSQIVGLFADPQEAHDVQGKVLASYGMDDLVLSTYSDDHFVELCGLGFEDSIDPEEPNHRWSK